MWSWESDRDRVHELSAPTKPVDTLVDNRPGNRMVDAVRRLMRDSLSMDIATGYVEVGALLDLDGDWQTLKGMRLLMGDEVTRVWPKRIFLC